MDATHPQHNAVLAGCWIKRGKRFFLKSNTGQRHLNINGVIDVQTMAAVIRFDDTINAESTIAPFKQIEAAYRKAVPRHRVLRQRPLLPFQSRVRLPVRFAD